MIGRLVDLGILGFYALGLCPKIFRWLNDVLFGGADWVSFLLYL
jgi:hypothetical protein